LTSSLPPSSEVVVRGDPGSRLAIVAIAARGACSMTARTARGGAPSLRCTMWR
jgi:hypothetical protein